MIAKYNELANEIKLTAMVVDKLPKKGIVGCIYLKKALPDGYEAYIWFKKYRLSFIDWLFRRTHQWELIGYEDVNTGEFLKAYGEKRTLEPLIEDEEEIEHEQK